MREIINFSEKYEVWYLSPARNCFYYIWMYCIDGPKVVLYADRDLVFPLINMELNTYYADNLIKFIPIKFFDENNKKIKDKLGKAIRFEVFDSNYELGTCLGYDFCKNYKINITLDTKAKKIFAEFSDAGEFTDKTESNIELP